MDLDLIKKLKKTNETKIIMLVMDGLGGLPSGDKNLTELESAYTPNLDELASRGICGLQHPVGPGITPGSGPGHLALFGYNPIKYQVGRGVLSALGINFKLESQDVAARGNFCTIDKEGYIIDRRAGRIQTKKNEELCRLLRDIELPNVEIFVETVKDYRFLLVLRGEGLSSKIKDTDPQKIGEKPLSPKSFTSDGDQTVDLLKQFIDQSSRILADRNPANMVLLRGFSKIPDWPSIQDIYGLKSAAIAGYPMYRGLARLLGMDIIESDQTVNNEFSVLENNWNDYDFFYVHIKGIDSAGEDGDYNRKKALIEEVDKAIPRLINLNPDVIIITGDHSTPTLLKYHSWHPVPVLIWSEHCRMDNVNQFGERACITGGLGSRFKAENLMTLALANAMRLEKFGA